MESRRSFIGKMLAAGALASVSLDEALAAPLNKKALLYDVMIGSFSSESIAREYGARVAKEAPELAKFMRLGKQGQYYKLFLDVNTIAEHADTLDRKLTKEGFDAYKQLHPMFYNANTTQGRFANLIIERSLPDTVKKYTTTYDSQEATATVRSLLEYYRKNGFNSMPKRGDVVPIPIRWLKVPYQIGMEQGKEYSAVDLKRGQTLLDIAETMEGDAKDNYKILKRFNAIEDGQERYLLPGSRIMIPKLIVTAPEEPIVINGTEEAPRIIHEPINPTPEAKRSAEIAKEYEERIPEVSKSISAYLRQQSLGVLRGTEMPGVLLESFNIKNFGHRRFYSNERNLQRLATAYGQGILDYCAKHPQVDKIIIDNGHGEKDPGTNDPASGMTETQFTKRIQRYTADFLRSNGKRVYALNYTGAPSAIARVRYYVGEANRIGDPHNSVYIATHVDAMGTGHQPPPRAFVNTGRQPKSKELAACILNRAVPFYQSEYR